MKRPHFTLRDLFWLVLIVAACCGVRAYRMAILVCAVAALNFLLQLTGAQCAKLFPKERNPLMRRRWATFSPTCPMVPWPILIIAVYQASFLVYQVTYLMTTRYPYLRTDWYEPVGAGLSLHIVHSVVLVTLNLYLLLSFYADCYGTGKVSPSFSFLTACASTLLVMAHFAVPY